MSSTLLKSKQLFSFKAAATWIHCEMGQIWLTDDGQDVILACGEKWLTRGKAPIVIEALQDSKIAIGEIQHKLTPAFNYHADSALAG